MFLVKGRLPQDSLDGEVDVSNSAVQCEIKFSELISLSVNKNNQDVTVLYGPRRFEHDTAAFTLESAEAREAFLDVVARRLPGGFAREEERYGPFRNVFGPAAGVLLSATGGPATSVDYLVDASGPLSQVVAETSGGRLEGYYVRGSDLLSVLRPGAEGAWLTRLFHSDGLGSIRALAGENGSVTDRYTYSAFGELVAHEGSDPNPYRFAGEPFEPGAELYYNRARWLDPVAGRFASRDTFAGVIQNPLTLHPYIYANDSPTRFTDATGKMSSLVESALLFSAMTLALTAGLFIGDALLWGDGRPLTPGEMQIADSIFRGTVDLQKPRVYNRELFNFQGGSYAVTPRGNIFYSQFDDSYADDFAAAPLKKQKKFIHEMTHVWQQQQGRVVWLEGGAEQVLGFAGAKVYNYLPIGEADIFEAFGIEQQAQMVEDYYYLKHGGVVPGAPDLCLYEELLPFTRGQAGARRE